MGGWHKPDPKRSFLDKLYSKIEGTLVETLLLLLMITIMGIVAGWLVYVETQYAMDKRAFYHKNSGRNP